MNSIVEKLLLMVNDIKNSNKKINIFLLCIVIVFIFFKVLSNDSKKISSIKISYTNTKPQINTSPYEKFRSIKNDDIKKGDQPIGQFHDGIIHHDRNPICRGLIDYDSVNDAWICSYYDKKKKDKISIWFPNGKSHETVVSESLFRRDKTLSNVLLGFSAVTPEGPIEAKKEKVPTLSAWIAQSLTGGAYSVEEINTRKFKNEAYIYRHHIKFPVTEKEFWDSLVRKMKEFEENGVQGLSDDVASTDTDKLPKPIDKGHSQFANSDDVSSTDTDKLPKPIDKGHSQFMQDENYALSAALLNATWQQIKPNVTEPQYEKILQEQRQWIRKGRDEIARQHASSMPELEAYTKALQDRTAELTSIIAVSPKSASYDADWAEFTISVQDGGISIEGNAASYSGNTCFFEGSGKLTKGWTVIQHDGYNNFYLLVTRTGAQIVYAGSGISQGCGDGVDFNYSYRKK